MVVKREWRNWKMDTEFTKHIEHKSLLSKRLLVDYKINLGPNGLKYFH